MVFVSWFIYNSVKNQINTKIEINYNTLIYIDKIKKDYPQKI